MFDRVHGLELARGHRIDRARAEVIDLARRGTESQRQIIYSVRSLLQIVARAYAKVPADAANCNQYLTALTGNVPWIRGLSVAGADGRDHMLDRVRRDRIERVRSAAFSECAAFP